MRHLQGQLRFRSMLSTPVVNPFQDPPPHADAAQREARSLRLCTYNVQTGVGTHHYRQYLTESWKHLLPDPKRLMNLRRMADMLRPFDLVGLQEVDAGSLRSGFMDQTHYLALQAGFPFWRSQTNRRLGRIAQHSNGLLSRFQPREIADYKLPGLPGRGGLLVGFGPAGAGLTLMILHLALSRRARLRQMDYVAELVEEFPHLILMGDLNCQPGSREMQMLTRRTGLRAGSDRRATFPSWRPQRRLDHILVSPSLEIEQAGPMPFPVSDHLPFQMEIRLPEGLDLHRAPTHEPALEAARRAVIPH